MSPHALTLTALPVEYNAVRGHLKAIKEVTHQVGTVYEVGSFHVSDSFVWTVSLAEIGVGNVGAAAEAERAITFLEPDVMVFVGVAGGLKDVSIGDVVVATKVYGYESGKAGREFKIRPTSFNSSYALQQRARAEAKREDWIRYLSDPSAPHSKVFVAPIAAGEKSSRRDTLHCINSFAIISKTQLQSRWKDWDSLRPLMPIKAFTP